jgi:NtrC-family two-component system sensor histidine kinase KinB
MQPMNTLNRRFLAGLSPLLLILVGVGVYAIVLFDKLGGSIDVILRENYQSVVAAEGMKESADRMDAGLLLALANEEERGRRLFVEGETAYAAHLRREMANITLPGEGELARRADEGNRSYLEQAQAFLALPMNGAARRVFYFARLQPAFADLKATADRILVLNQQNMVAANDAARRESRRSSNLLAAALGIGFAAALALAWLLARSLTRPLEMLTESARRMGEGNWDQVVAVKSPGEVDALAQAFNRMAAKLRDYRQSTTEQIVEAQQTMAAALRAFPDPILVLSRERGVRLQNAAADRFLREIGDPLALPALRAAVDGVLRGGPDYRPNSFDKALTFRAGDEERHFLPQALAMRDDGGALSGIVVALQDVTRFRMADDLKTNLIATVSHELKTPLTSVQMAVYLLLEEGVGALTPKQAELLIAARNNSEKLLEMIETLLDLARFEGGASLIEKQAVAPDALLREALEREKDFLRERGFTVAVEIEAGLPRVAVSRPRLLQVFANLISNAVKYSPRRGCITLSLRRETGSLVRFAVRDEGIGIPADAQRRIFEKFFRVSEADQEGAGLGLAMAREIVAAHGGAVGVESAPGKGSEFFFTLPAAPVLS